jgi:hypothetical protein
MNRRKFIAASAATAAIAGIPATADAAEKKQMYFEFIHCQVTNNALKGRLEKYWREAAIPALNRFGISQVGVFKPKYGAHGLDYYVLIPHASLESFEMAWDKIAKDADYQSAGKGLIDPPMDNPLYYRTQTSLLKAFSHLPTLEIPEHIKGKKGRFFEVRVYESHNRHKAKLKVEMFNKGGEIALFKKTGLNPVMFGEMLAGDKMPNLTYILGFENMEEQSKAWDTFRNSDGWKKMKANPRYKDTVSSVTDFILTPTGISQM